MRVLSGCGYWWDGRLCDVEQKTLLQADAAEGDDRKVDAEQECQLVPRTCVEKADEDDGECQLAALDRSLADCDQAGRPEATVRSAHVDTVSRFE